MGLDEQTGVMRQRNWKPVEVTLRGGQLISKRVKTQHGGAPLQ